jgi:hypothetical protein
MKKCGGIEDGTCAQKYDVSWNTMEKRVTANDLTVLYIEMHTTKHYTYRRNPPVDKGG